MKPLYTQDEFDAAKSRDFLPLECLHCHKTFTWVKSQVQTASIGGKGITGDFCSRKCKDEHQSSIVDVPCSFCGKNVKKQACQITKYQHHFCCRSHAAKYHNGHKKGGCNVSKLERWLQEQLKAIFPCLEFHFNHVDAIKAELDIYLPSLRLAFELNGIFHYEPIFGPERLSKTQSNDQRKILACAENGIGLCIIDVSREKYMKPAKVQKYLDIIVNIIREKLLEY